MHEPSNPPFSSELETHPDIPSNVNRFQTLKDRPEYVVKELSFEALKANQELHNLGETEQKYMLRHAGHGQTLLREFSEETGINIPQTQLLIGANEQGERVLYRVSEQVMGHDLKDVLAGDEVSDKQVSDLVGSIFEYYKSKFESKEDFCSDIAHLGQYRLGRTLSGTEVLLYLVDADPYYGRGEATVELEGEDEDDYTIEDMIANTRKLLGDIEAIRGRPLAPELKNTIQEFIESTPSMNNYPFL